MSFQIKILDKPVPKKQNTFGTPYAYGEINIGSFSERIQLNMEYWSRNDYLKQWVDALERILNSPGDQTSSLIVGMCDPTNSKYKAPIEIWSLFKRNEKVLVQNSHVSINKLVKPFESDLVSFYESINFNEEVNTSEWETTITDISQWLDDLKLQLKNSH